MDNDVLGKLVAMGCIFNGAVAITLMVTNARMDEELTKVKTQNEALLMSDKISTVRCSMYKSAYEAEHRRCTQLERKLKKLESEKIETK